MASPDTLRRGRASPLELATSQTIKRSQSLSSLDETKKRPKLALMAVSPSSSQELKQLTPLQLDGLETWRTRHVSSSPQQITVRETLVALEKEVFAAYDAMHKQDTDTEETRVIEMDEAFQHIAESLRLCRSLLDETERGDEGSLGRSDLALEVLALTAAIQSLFV
ncbi:hypothetical protein LTR86_010982 [Recurvomyces mirabilis]|nr:hypothetical protein LTR86_010982 [Recurvomyces mirabilis]